jgi:hypothetical protein
VAPRRANDGLPQQSTFPITFRFTREQREAVKEELSYDYVVPALEACVLRLRGWRYSARLRRSLNTQTVKRLRRLHALLTEIRGMTDGRDVLCVSLMSALRASAGEYGRNCGRHPSAQRRSYELDVWCAALGVEVPASDDERFEPLTKQTLLRARSSTWLAPGCSHYPVPNRRHIT